MKTYANCQYLRLSLIVGIGWMSTALVSAQDFTTLRTFTPFYPSNVSLAPNSGGVYPLGGLALSGKTLYGNAYSGGASGSGTIYSLRTDGTGFTVLHDFSPTTYSGDFSFLLNSDGMAPEGRLLLSGDTLYGTAYAGGTLGHGTVFALKTNGTGFATLHNFTAGGDGAIPKGELVLSPSGKTLYGTAWTSGGGSLIFGTVFALNTDGTDFKVLLAFTGGSDGARPTAGLVLSGDTLYGTASAGGNANNGTVFKVGTNGTGFAVLHSFTATTGTNPYASYVINSDGAGPVSRLVLSGGILYGTASGGGGAHNGTVFAVHTDGSGFQTLHSFSDSLQPNAYWTNYDGIDPFADLVLSASGKTLYGAGLQGGTWGTGTLFAINTDGTGYTNLYSFTRASNVSLTDTSGGVGGTGYTNGDGFSPRGLVLLGNSLYGTAGFGGMMGHGTVFGLSFPALSATLSATPARVQIGDTIEVVVNVKNNDPEAITGVRLSSAITVDGTGRVSPAGFRGPTMVPSLAPDTTTSFTYLYTATNNGRVNFTAAATGTGPDGVVTSAPATSTVLIAPQADLMVKSTDTNDMTFAGVGVFQQPPPFNDQNVSQPVSTNGVAAYIVRLQNDERVPQSYTLRGSTNGIDNWAIKVLAGGVNIIDALTSANGWTTPQLAPDGSLDLKVSLARLPGPGVTEDSWIQITALADSTSSSADALDSLRLHATLVPVPVKVTINKVNPGGYTPASITAGWSDINAPLVPVTGLNLLANNLTVIHGGLVADGVTPLVIKLEADPTDLVQSPDGKEFLFKANFPASDNVLGGDPIAQRLALLRNGIWQWATNVVLTASSPIAYVQLLPIASDDLHITVQPPGVFVNFSVQDKTTGIEAGDVRFALQKPPIALVHGYATAGDWGNDFKAVLGNSRPYGLDGSPNNFICTVKYGQDVVPGWAGFTRSYVGLPAYMNTVASLADCAQMLQSALFGAMAPLHANWAFTRHDVVGHSQGGVLARMLCNASATPTIAWPFRNDANFNRGRFHRVVTIGSPHNGSRLLRYMLDLQQLPIWNNLNYVGSLGVLTLFAQAKFDPFLEQIQTINDPNGPWWPDPDARFHLVRMTIDDGLTPGKGDLTRSYILLGLNVEGGGLAVIPGGSDGVVDFPSMGAQDYFGDPAPNVFTFPKAKYICHAAPNLLFSADSSETADPEVALHVINTLDQQPSPSAGAIVFWSFPRFPRLGTNEQFVIDHFAQTRRFELLPKGPVIRPQKLDLDPSYHYQLPFPSNLPPVGDVSWFAQVYDAGGITDDGVELTPGGTNNSQVTVTVDQALVGDVVLSGVYLSVSNTVVIIPPTLVVSKAPSGATLTSFQLVPGNIALPVGSVVSPEFLATYSDGSSSLRYAIPGTFAAFSTQPSVVSVKNPQNWRLSAVGAAQISVTWSGLTAVSQITAFDPAVTAPPSLSLQATRDGQLSVAWAGFTADYVLESSGDLGQSNSWQPVDAVPISAGGWTTVSLEPTNAQQFLRLRWTPTEDQLRTVYGWNRTGSGGLWSDPSNWDSTGMGGGAPVTNGVGVVDIYFGAASTPVDSTVDRSFSIRTLRFGAASPGVHLIASDTSIALTLGIGGIVKSGAGEDLIDPPVFLDTDQAWTIDDGTVTLAALDLHGHQLSVGGNGQLVIARLSGGGSSQLAAFGPGQVHLLAGAPAFAGSIAVSGGNLMFEGSVLDAAAGLSLAGGTLTLPKNFNLASPTPLLLGGGVIDATGAHGSLGVVQLSGDNVLRLGTGTDALRFAGIALADATGHLWVNDWTGNAGAAGTGRKIFVTASPTAAVLAKITFTGTNFDTGSKRLATGEIVPFAKPSTLLPTDGATLLVAYGKVTATVVAVDGQSFSTAMNLATSGVDSQPYNSGVKLNTTAAVTSGDNLVARFWIRRILPASGTARTQFNFEKASGNYDKSVEFPLTLNDGSWQQRTVKFKSGGSYALGAAEVCFFLGYGVQTIQIGGLELLNYRGDTPP